MTRHGEPLAFYLAHVDDETEECILWPYSDAAGYGHLKLDGRVQYVHRLACERRYGPASTGMWAIHLPVVCHNPSCFNWRHLRWGTPSENTRDTVKDGTRSPLKPWHASLTWEQVRQIRSRYEAGGISQRALAAEYGVAQSAIWRIVTYRSWPPG